MTLWPKPSALSPRSSPDLQQKFTIGDREHAKKGLLVGMVLSCVVVIMHALFTNEALPLTMAKVFFSST